MRPTEGRAGRKPASGKPASAGAATAAESSAPFRTTADQRGAAGQRPPGGVTGKGFMPGRSGNPSGRPRGMVGYVRERTNDGRMLVDFMVDIVAGKPFTVEMIFPAKDQETPPKVLTYERTPDVEDRIRAAAWLADRGWGKPPQTLEVSTGRDFIVQHRLYPPGVDPLDPGSGDAIVEATVVPRALPNG